MKSWTQVITFFVFSPLWCLVCIPLHHNLNKRQKNRSGNQKWTIQRNGQHRAHTKRKTKTQHNIYWTPLDTTNTNNIRHEPFYKQQEVETIIYKIFINYIFAILLWTYFVNFINCTILTKDCLYAIIWIKYIVKVEESTNSISTCIYSQPFFSDHLY